MKHLITLCSVMLCMAFTSIGTSITITGKVTDEKGVPIPNVSIVIKGTTNGTATDANGSFSLSVHDEKTTLTISAIGYESQDIKVKDKRVFSIVLKTKNQNLEEVVVVGYGAVAKKDITGSIASIPSMQASPYQMNALQGRVAGLSITQGHQAKQGYLPYNNQSNATGNNYNREGYDAIEENAFLKVKDNPLSTFSIDVDAASYSNVRRMINAGQLPPKGAVRIEELINYFSYQYPQPEGDAPFSINTEISSCPWNTKHKLVLVGLQGKKIDAEKLPASNLTFLIDVSGSMFSPDKLPLVRASLKLLVDQLREQDKVAIVAYAGNAGLVLPSTSGSDKTKIKDAIDKLEAGGSTAGGAGIKLAYKIAKDNFVKGGNNRVILCTDGDFNVGVSSDDELNTLIEEEKKSGVYLTILGYGQGNYQDAKMQKLADKGNGNHSYIDNINEAKKVLINEFGGTLFTIAKDVKLQIEFNPLKVQSYRLIGYENRLLAKEDFNNDKKDAGELGSGHTVTALYEVIPTGIKDETVDSVDALRYQQAGKTAVAKTQTNEIMNIKFRYKKPDEDVSKLLEYPLIDHQVNINQTSDNFRFAAAVAEFGMVLRDSKYKNKSDYRSIQTLAQKALGQDKEGYRKEFLSIVENAALLAGKDDEVAGKE